VVVLNEEAIAEDRQVMTEVGMRERLQASSLEVGRIAGRVETALLTKHISEKVIAESFIQLREGKKYKDLEFRTPSGETKNFSSLDEVCKFLFGKTLRSCELAAQNYELLGPQLFESAEQLGFRHRDYRALRVLPADDQALVKSAIADTNDRDTVTDLIGELTERHAKKIAEKDKALASLSQQVAVKERRVSELHTKNDALQEQLDTLTVSKDAARAVALEKRTKALMGLRDASLAMLGMVNRFDQAMHNVLALGDPSAEDDAANTLRATYQRLADLSIAHGMPVDFAEIVTPSWMPPMTADLSDSEAEEV
jgi:phage shock protein A